MKDDGILGSSGPTVSIYTGNNDLNHMINS